MRAIVLSAILVSLAGVCLFADAESEINNLFGSLTDALAEMNTPEFMAVFDKNMPGYEQLRTDVEALANEAEVSSSVEPIKNEGTDAKRAVDLDWYLQIRSLVQDGPIVRRREVIHCELVKEKNRWKIVSLQPIEFFASADLAH
jgi:hypothetical protein